MKKEQELALATQASQFAEIIKKHKEDSQPRESSSADPSATQGDADVGSTQPSSGQDVDSMSATTLRLPPSQPGQSDNEEDLEASSEAPKKDSCDEEEEECGDKVLEDIAAEQESQVDEDEVANGHSQQ